MTDDLQAIWDEAFPGPIGPWDDKWAAHRAGIPLRALRDVGALNVTVHQRRWEQDARGQRALIVPVRSQEDFEILDLVAFRLETPRAFWTMTGAVPFLGERSLDHAAHFGRPLMVHESPFDWLKAGRTGIAVLDWGVYWPLYFEGLPALQYADPAWARRATTMFSRPIPVPPALVPRT